MAETAQAVEASSQAPAPKTPVYEVGFHIVPAVGEEGVAAVVEKIKKQLGESEIIAEGAPERKHLAYEIERASQGKREHFTESYFGWIKFAPTVGEEMGAQINKLEEALRADKNIMRYLLIETVREDLMQQKSRAVFASDRLEGETLKKVPREVEKAGEVSEEELAKSLEALTGEQV